MKKNILSSMLLTGILGTCLIADPTPNITLSSLSKTFHMAPELSTTTETNRTGTWYRNFNDTTLNEIVRDGLENNLSIHMAEASLKTAIALSNISRATFSPDISGLLSSTRGNTNYGRTGTLSKAGLDATWNLDIFGKTQATVSAKEAEVLVQEAHLNHTKNTVMADIVQAFSDWQLAESKTRTTSQLLKTHDTWLNLLKKRAAAGLIDQSVWTRAAAQRSELAASMPALESAANTAIYKLAQLLNTEEAEIRDMLSRSDTSAAKLPSPEAIMTRPLSTIQNRPDIRAADAMLRAANASTREAKASLWPQVSLAAFFGVQDATDGLPVGDNPAWSLGGSVQIPLLNFGRLDGAIDASMGNEDYAKTYYENTVTMALQETKTTLSEYLTSRRSLRSQTEGMTHYQATLALTEDRFKNGLTDLTPVLAAEIELNQAKLKQIDIERQAISAYIRLETTLAE